MFEEQYRNMDVSNTKKLNFLTKMAADSAREELDKIHLRQLEDVLPEDIFTALFNSICLIDETQKCIQEAMRSLLEDDPESKPPLEITAFDTEKTTFRLFYMMRDQLCRWRIENLKHPKWWGEKSD